jgi:hypothetical protein
MISSPELLLLMVPAAPKNIATQVILRDVFFDANGSLLLSKLLVILVGSPGWGLVIGGENGYVLNQ